MKPIENQIQAVTDAIEIANSVAPTVETIKECQRDALTTLHAIRFIGMENLSKGQKTLLIAQEFVTAWDTDAFLSDVSLSHYIKLFKNILNPK